MTTEAQSGARNELGASLPSAAARAPLSQLNTCANSWRTHPSHRKHAS